jgi:hypothetical protein
VKLDEIVWPNTINDVGFENLLPSLEENNMEILRLTTRIVIGRSQNKYTLIVDSKIVGFLSLGPTEVIDDKHYLPVKMLFVIEQFRKTRASGLFILGLSKLLKYPLIIGNEADKGGSLSKDGGMLLASLAEKSNFSVSILNFKTNKITKFSNSDIGANDPDITLIIDGQKFPFISEAHIDMGTFEYLWNEDL